MKNKIYPTRRRYAIFIFFLMTTATIIGGLSTAQVAVNHTLDSIVALIPLTQQNILRDIVTNQITILDVDQSKTSVVVLVSSQEFAWLSAMNLAPSVVPDDIAIQQGWKHTAEFGRDFHSYSQMTTALQNIADTYPDITHLYNLGQSVQGRIIWGLKITDNPDIEENEPEVRICGLHHGNEFMSAELPLNLAYHLVQNYSVDPAITDLVDNREIWIIPMVNPDGREADTRYNAHGIDLNRNYGYMPENSNPYSEPETQAMRNNALQNNFVLSLSFHCSGDVVNYVWNYKTQPVPDNAAVVSLSNQYGSHNGYWVVEGYDWYQTLGDCNDFSYGCRGDMDWTIEVQDSNIPQAWNLNRDAMLEIIDAANMGLTGVVTNANNGQPIPATIWVDEASWPCFADPQIGDYHRVLLPGTYTVHYRANGFAEKTFTVDVESGDPTVLDVDLNPNDQYFAYQVTTCDYYAPSENYQNNPTEGISILGQPDEVYASLGVSGSIIVDMTNNVTDLPDAPDLKVFEGDGTTDGYSVSVSANWNGPWASLGAGMGTSEFDLVDGSVESARYVKIIDDGTGSPSEMNPGCDIDAVQNLAAESANQPPNIPTQPNGPGSGQSNMEYSYTTTTTDPESQQVYYLWSWGDTNGTWIGPFNSGAIAQASHTWAATGNYTVKVKAKDIAGSESGWSAGITVRIQSGPLIEIGEITGGFGVSTTVKNIGDSEASNIPWTITLDGGLLLLGRQTTGMIAKIQPGFSPQIKSDFILGIGPVTIKVTADVAEKTASAFLLGPFVIIKK
ncbi:MAG TPA: hypothetical protein DSN98_04875 [Thermoplasmata archaeon]|nr:MAG TPA: hypothetical protein DSN98_04875 [Thermoplasmata archaeon]